MVQFATNEEDGGSNPSVGTFGNVAESGLRHSSRKRKGCDEQSQGFKSLRFLLEYTQLNVIWVELHRKKVMLL